MNIFMVLYAHVSSWLWCSAIPLLLLLLFLLGLQGGHELVKLNLHSEQLLLHGLKIGLRRISFFGFYIVMTKN